MITEREKEEGKIFWEFVLLFVYLVEMKNDIYNNFSISTKNQNTLDFWVARVVEPFEKFLVKIG